MAQTNTNNQKTVSFRPSEAIVDDFLSSGKSYRQYEKQMGIPRSTLWDMVKAEDIRPKKSLAKNAASKSRAQQRRYPRLQNL
jgi:hypothetical protein